MPLIQRGFAVAAAAYLIASTIAGCLAVDQFELCAPLMAEPNANGTAAGEPRKFPCRCSSSSTDGDHRFAVHVDCESRQLNDTHFATVGPFRLRPFTRELKLSGNLLDDAPQLAGTELQRLDLSHNRLRTLYDRSFAGIGSSLHDLVLSWNQIDRVSLDAFDGCTALRSLDLRRNHLGRLAENVFLPLVALQQLDLSLNRNLSETFDRPDFRDVYRSLGVTRALRTLRAEECGLHGPAEAPPLSLAWGSGLQELWLRYNRLERMPSVAEALRVLDVSGNRLRSLDAASRAAWPVHVQLAELYVQDMPNLTAVEAGALAGLPQLRRVSLAGSWRLRRWDARAFGADADAEADRTGSALVELDLSGTGLTGLNMSLETAGGRRMRQVLDRVDAVDVSGAPLVCDCDVGAWLRDRRAAGGNRTEVRGECAAPAELRQRRLAELTGAEAELRCSTMPEWLAQALNGLATFALLVVCVAATWLLVTHIRPRSRRDRLQKVGDASPYARVTIEPNRADL